jgi:ribosomal subunit interface protein
MQINIAGQQVEIGSALQVHVREKLELVVGKYFAHAIDSHVIFKKNKSFFVAEIKVHEHTHKHALAESEDSDVYKAFDSALHKIEAQLRKYKSKLRDKHYKDK